MKEIAIFLKTTAEFNKLPSAILFDTPLVHSNHSIVDKSEEPLKL
jgi:hypothetical protein